MAGGFFIYTYRHRCDVLLPGTMEENNKCKIVPFPKCGILVFMTVK